MPCHMASGTCLRRSLACALQRRQASSNQHLVRRDLGRCPGHRLRQPNPTTRSCQHATVAHHAELTVASAAERSAPGLLQGLLSGGARTTEAAKAAWASLVSPGDTVVDATCGNGHDTLALARLVGPHGCVIAMDIQAEAVRLTEQQLQQHLPPEQMPALRLLRASHSDMQDVLQREGAARPALVCFNLGWMPGQPDGCKEIKTETGTTLEALRQAHEAVADGGSVSVVAYIGHEGGMAEYEAVSSFMAELDSRSWVSSETRLLNRSTAPRLLLSHRLAGRGAERRWRPNVAFAEAPQT